MNDTLRSLITPAGPGNATLNADPAIHICLNEDYKRTFEVWHQSGILSRPVMLKKGFRSAAGAVRFAVKFQAAQAA